VIKYYIYYSLEIEIVIIINNNNNNFKMVTVTIQGALSSKPRSVVPVVANNSPCTTISQRLAKQLGLTQFYDVYITDILGLGGKFIAKWKRSIFPIVIYIPELDNVSVSCYPIINCVEGDAFWEMIIGKDVWTKNINIMKCYLSNESEPTHGPRFEQNVHYMGHNIGYADVSTILERDISEYIEYECLDSKSISRLAINYKKRTVVVTYITSDDDIYSYKKVSKDLIHKLINGESKGKTISIIRNSCTFTKPDTFPDTIRIFTNSSYKGECCLS